MNQQILEICFCTRDLFQQGYEYAMKKMRQGEQGEDNVSEEEVDYAGTEQGPNSRRNLFPSGTVGVLPCGMLV